MDPRLESAIRYACEQQGLIAEHFLAVVRERMKATRIHPDVKRKPKRQE
jgi:hypothetical protein